MEPRAFSAKELEQIRGFNCDVTVKIPDFCFFSTTNHCIEFLILKLLKLLHYWSLERMNIDHFVCSVTA